MSVLVSGMSHAEATAAVVDAAIKARGDSAVGIWSETGHEKVLIGIARAGAPAFAIEVDKAEHDGLKLLAILGEPMTPTKRKLVIPPKERR